MSFDGGIQFRRNSIALGLSIGRWPCIPMVYIEFHLLILKGYIGFKYK